MCFNKNQKTGKWRIGQAAHGGTEVRCISKFWLLLFLFLPFMVIAQTGQSVLFTNLSGLALTGLYFSPANTSNFPAVVIMHGSGGLWRNDDPAAGVMNPNFREWATNLVNSGYAALFVDSYTPRGLVEFRSKRPAEDPALDDSLCSPAYERPKDAHAALRYLRSLPEVQKDRIGLIAFSQGAESALSAVLDRNLDRQWSSSYLLTNGSSTNKSMPAPPRLQNNEKGFAVAMAFYPGCGFYSYYGSPSATNAGLYLPETPTLILHGSEDPLYADNLYPDRFRLKSRSEAVVRNYSNNLLGLVVFQGAEHSFDETQLPGNPANDDPNQAAKRAGRAKAFDWLRLYLKPLRLSIGRETFSFDGPGDVSYQVGRSTNLTDWSYSEPYVFEEPGGGVFFHSITNIGFLKLKMIPAQLEALR